MFLVIANMIGAGVFTTSGFSLADLGSANWVMFAWLVGAIIALCGALSYGLLARQVTESGGEYIFLNRRLHPAAGYVAGLLSLFVGFSGAAAYVAMTLEIYIGHWIHPGWIAIVLVLIAWLIHALHIKLGACIQNTVVVIKLVVLGFFILYAGLYSSPVVGNSPVVADISLLSFASTLVWVSFSYSGFNAAIYVAGESADPAVNVPRAILFGTLITSLFYLALNAVFVYSTPLAQISAYPDIATRAALYIGGQALSDIVRITIIMALMTSLSSLFMAGPRVYAKMADDGLLPQCFSAGGRAPLMAATLQAGIVICFIVVSHLRELISYLGMTLSFSTMLTVSTLFKSPENLGYWRLLAPILFILSTAMAVVLASIRNPWECLASILTIVLFLLLYYFKVCVRGVNGKSS